MNTFYSSCWKKCVCVCVCLCGKCDNKFQWLKIQRQTRSVWARAAASWHLLGWKIKGTPRGLKYLSPVAATAQQSSCIIARAPTCTPASFSFSWPSLKLRARFLLLAADSRQKPRRIFLVTCTTAMSKEDNEKERETSVAVSLSAQCKWMSGQEQFYASSHYLISFFPPFARASFAKLNK